MTAARFPARRLIDRIWYGGSGWYRCLLPLTWLFSLLVSIRHALYRQGVLRSLEVGRPVIVVGNIASGGTGKTPVTLWLAGRLREKNFRPGIASRGYGGKVGALPVMVADDSDPALVGDEPLLMARRAVCPVVVHPDRVAAARMLVQMGCNVIVADDGLQHYRLKRQFEIAVIDADRWFGNGHLLPAGPLREPVSRLGSVDRLMLQGDVAPSRANLLPPGIGRSCFRLSAAAAHRVQGTEAATLDRFAGQRVHAVAALGNPSRFFRLLENAGIDVIPHAFPDHAAPGREQLDFGDNLNVLMTEKDAVKVRQPAPAHWWYVPVELSIASGEKLQWLDDLQLVLKKETREK